MKKRFLFAFLFPLIFVSCNKDVVEADANFQGNWIGSDATKTYYLNVNDESRGTFIIEEDDGSREKKTGILRKDRDRLIMKGIFVYEIIEPPHELDSMITFMLHDHEYPVTWMMKLKSPKSWGGNEVYYYK